MKQDAVVITGLGFMTPLGDDIAQITKSIEASKGCVRPLTGQDYETMPAAFGGQIEDDELAKYDLCPIKFKMFKPYLKYGFIAASNALKDAGLYDGKSFDSRYAEKDRGVFVCQGTNGDNAEGLFDAFCEASNDDGSLDMQNFAGDAINMVHPKWMLPSISNNLIFFLTAEFGLRGDNNNMTYSAVGGAYMLEAAFDSLKSGKCSMAVVASSDSILNWQAMDDVAKSGLLCEGGKGAGAKQMLPFGKDAVGSLPSEGAACLVLELEENAKARKAKIYGRLLDTWQHCAASDVLTPCADGKETEAVLSHLLSAAPTKADTLVSLNGMSQQKFDEAELAGLEKVVKARGEQQLTCSSAKHLFCHTFSASFTVEFAATLLALQNDFVFSLPTAPHSSGLSSSLFCTTPTKKSHKYGVVLSQGLGGNTGGVLFERL